MVLQAYNSRIIFITDGVEDNVSLLEHIGNFLAPMFKPLGMNDGKIVSALIAGFTGKRSGCKHDRDACGKRRNDGVVHFGTGVFVVFDVRTFVYAVRRDRRNDAKRVGFRMENRRCRRLSVRACVGLLVHSLSDRGGLLI